MTLALCIGATGVMAAKEATGKDRCVELGYKWYGMDDYQYTYLWLFADGSFAASEGGGGNWRKNGAAFALQAMGGCYPLYAGTSNRGFMECTYDGPGEFNFYIIKSTPKKNCEDADFDNQTAIQGGPSLFSPH